MPADPDDSTWVRVTRSLVLGAVTAWLASAGHLLAGGTAAIDRLVLLLLVSATVAMPLSRVCVRPWAAAAAACLLQAVAHLVLDPGVALSAAAHAHHGVHSLGTGDSASVGMAGWHAAAAALAGWWLAQGEGTARRVVALRVLRPRPRTRMPIVRSEPHLAGLLRALGASVERSVLEIGAPAVADRRPAVRRGPPAFCC
jgi:hypothetical protein